MDEEQGPAFPRMEQAEGEKETISAGQAFAAAMMGCIFGIALEKARVFEPVFIRTQMVFQTFLMLKMFLSAAATAMLVFAAASIWAPEKFTVVRTAFDACRGLAVSACGSFLVGVGMTISGACPGMVLAQIGTATPNSGFTLLGGLLGTLCFAVAEKTFQPLYSIWRADEKARFVDQWLGTSFVTLAIPMSLLLCAVVAVLEWAFPWQEEVAVNASNTATNVFAAHAWPPEVGGALIGILQIIALSTLDDSIGSSSSYSTIVSQLVRLCPSRSPQYKYMDAASKLTAGNLWQVIYVCFGIFGAFVSSLASNSLGQVAGVTPMAAFAGGFIMLFGSRLGAGCTSGHGISGFPLMYSSSVLAVPCMFAGAIITGFTMLHTGQYVYSDGSLGQPIW